MNEEKFNQQYSLLNPEQKKAVDTIEGPVFVMAGPGTGKTQILTLRIANILKESPGIDPENVLALTFTNTASYNMRERLSVLVGGELSHRTQISTFHSFAEEMIRSNSDFFPRFLGSRLISDIERIELLEEIQSDLDTKHFSVFKRRPGTMSSLMFSIDKIKNEGLNSKEFEQKTLEQFELSMKDEVLFYKVSRGDKNKGDIKPSELAKRERRRDKNLELGRLYDLYQSKIEENNFYDFSDLILSFIEVLESNEEFKMEMQERFQYLLVDEHQDTNDAQNKIIHLLIDNPVNEGKPNLFVVGDDKQAIYRFAGATEASFGELKNILSEMVVIDLVHNYRSGQHILDSAYSLISKSESHKQSEELESFFKDRSGVLEYREFSAYKSELLWMAKDIKSRIDSGENPDEIAVLYRNNKDASGIRQIFDSFEIPYKDLSKINLLEDIDILKLFLLLRSADDFLADEYMARVLYIDFLKFDVFFVQQVLSRLRGTRRGPKKNIYSILSDPKILKELGAADETQAAAKRFVEFLVEAKKKSENEQFSTYFSWFVRESGYLEYLLKRPNAVLALSKLEKIFDEIKNETTRRGSFSLSDFLYYLDSLKRHNLRISIPQGSLSGVSMMTYHGSKGLEFDTVYLVRAISKRSVSGEIDLPFDDFSDGSLDDERRLFYVALTRAKKNALISSYVLNEEGKEKNKTSFVDDVDGVNTVSVSAFEAELGTEFAAFFEEGKPRLLSITNQEFITDKFMKSKLSVSALNNYVESPILYFFRNLIHLPESKTVYLDFGNLIHGTLEDYFNECKNKGEILGVKILEESYKKVLAGNPAYWEFEDRGWGILESYFSDREKSFDVPMENELRVPALPFELREGQSINLTGVMDKVTRDKEGNIIVWDYKTGKSYSDMPKDRKEKIKRQATFYKLLLRHAYKGRFDFKKAVFDFVEPNSKGVYEQIEFDITETDLDELREIIQGLADSLLSGEFLKGNYKKDEKTKDYIELLDLIQGDPEQGEIF
ncbi:MAG: DNA helicase-2/ATP-dependent DNA helicase PcrA [Candidatus Paceibacteria bacterium]|jgi:DNA helicase-2/ATP-dependent DNA helicase PcrA